MSFPIKPATMFNPKLITANLEKSVIKRTVSIRNILKE